MDSSAIPSEEIAALKNLFLSTDGENWKINTDGNSQNFSFTTNICIDWQGIGCSCRNRSIPEFHPYSYYFYSTSINDDVLSNNNSTSLICHVAKIFLSGCNLQGRLPSSFFTAFPFLTHLHLGNNPLTGHLSLGENCRLFYLRALVIWKTYLTGNLSREPSAVKIQYFHLTFIIIINVCCC